MESQRPANAEDHLQDLTQSELEPVRKRLQSGWREHVTAEQEQAINDYVSDPKINAKLRTSPDLSTLTDQELSQFERLEEAIDLAGRRSQAITVWRGIAPENCKSILAMIETALESRQTFGELGIQSYSIQPSVAGFIAHDAGLVLELESKTGIYISELAGGNEDELLLSHFQRYIVLDVVRDVLITAAHGERVSVTLARLRELR